MRVLLDTRGNKLFPLVCFQSGPRVHVRFHCATICDFKEEKGNKLVSNVG